MASDKMLSTKPSDIDLKFKTKRYKRLLIILHLFSMSANKGIPDFPLCFSWFYSSMPSQLRFGLNKSAAQNSQPKQYAIKIKIMDGRKSIGQQ